MEGFIPASRVFGLDIQTLFSVLIHLFNLGVLAFVMSRLLYQPVCNFLMERNARISDSMFQVSHERHEVEKLKHRLEAELLSINEEQRAAAATAEQANAVEREQLLAATRAEAAELLSTARLEIEAEKANLHQEVKRTVVDLTSAMAAKYVHLSLDEKEQDRLFEEAIADLEARPWWEVRR